MERKPKIPEVCFSSTFDMDKLAKIRHHHYKKRLNRISIKITQFESNLLKFNEDIIRKDEKFYTRLYGGEHTTETL